MMKWGRSKKSPSSSSPRCPLLLSWFSKFKKSDRFPLLDPERDEGGFQFMERKLENSPELPGYGEDEEFRRMSFGKDGEKFPPSVCRNCLSMIVEEEGEGLMKFNEMVSNISQIREFERNFGGIKLNFREREMVPNLRAATEVPRQLPNGHDHKSPQEDRRSQWKSPHSARESKSLRSTRRRSRHIKVRSPRLNSAAISGRQSKEGRGGSHHEGDGREMDYEGYALVKCSYNPQGDFRESMMEMIAARGIRGMAAEMEELLACYLILNDDTYHDVIIKVFRQVWFELDRRGFWGDNYNVVGEDKQRVLSCGQ